MQNRLNSYLYSAVADFPVQYGEQGYQVQVELYDIEAKIEQITAYTFHPNRTMWWRVIMDWFVELFYGRTAVLIRVEGEPSALYVRVDDLSRILNISSQTILRSSEEGEVTNFLIEHQMQQTAKKIKALVGEEGIAWTAVEQNSVKELIEEFGYQNVFKVLDDPQFDPQRVALSLIEVGKQLAQYSPTPISPRAYDFKVSLPNVSIWKMEGFKKTKINLRDLVVVEEDLLQQTADKIRNLAQQEGMQWTPIEQESIETLVKKVGYQSVMNVINDHHFHTGWMACTLVEAGRKLGDLPASDSKCKNVYEFELDLLHLYVWKIEGYKKTKVDVGNFVITVEDVPRKISPRSSPTKTPVLARSRAQMKPPTILDKLTKIFMSDFPDEVEFKHFIMALGLDTKKMKHLASLADRVGYSSLTAILEQLSEDEKNVMVNTFIQIGKHLAMPAVLDSFFANFRLKYVGRKKEGDKRLTHAFAINKNDIFIVKDKLTEGTIKAISDSIKLNDLEDRFVRIKIMDDKRGHYTQDPKQTCHAVRVVRREAKFIELLHKNKKESGSDCIVVPFACELVSDNKENTIIFFQKKYDGDGEKLHKAPLFQVVYVLRDVAKGLAFMHKLRFVHVDVKPPNFLIEGDIDGVIPVRGKVADFGLTSEVGQLIPGGSPHYLAPEAFFRSEDNELKFKFSCDVDDKLDSFAFGVTILEVLHKLPDRFLGGLDQAQIDHEIEQYKQQVQDCVSKKEKTIKLALIGLAQQLMQWDPSQRMSCTEAASRLEEIAQGRILKMIAP